MNETKTRKEKVLNILFSVLLFGGLWGIVEAKEWKFEKLMKVIYHPAFASSTAVVAFALTLVLR